MEYLYLYKKMMPLHSYVVLASFALLFIAFTWQVLRVRRMAPGLMGTATIERRYFYSAKTALFITWGLFIIKAISPRLGYITVQAGLAWSAVALLLAGGLLYIVSLVQIGNSIAVGLPGKATNLKTTGLYRFSRNPVYIGVYLISIGSCLYFPDLINISFTIYGILVHHRIICQEERFLGERFGGEWTRYATQVRRYL